MRFEELLERWQRGRLSHDEAAAALGVSERTLRRWRHRYEEDGADGLVDRRVGQASPKRAPLDELERMQALYQQHYQGFTIKHFHEKLEQRHGYTLGYTTTRLYLQKTGTVSPAPRRGAHRRKRPRRPMRGLMLHQDGSKHVWLAGRPALDLVITMDDATSELYSAVLVDEEGTLSSLRGLVEVIERHGLFMELYTDRGSHYFFTPEAGGKVSKTQLTQVGRALKQLGIGHIPAYSPEARGRCERAFRTLQDRLPKELALAGITTIEAANRFLREVYLPEHNRTFAIAPEEPAARSWWSPRRSGATSSRSRRSASSATTTASPGAAASCRSRPRHCARTWCAPGSGSTTIPTAPSPSSKGPSGWPASRRPHLRRPRTWPRDHRDAASPVDLVDNAARCPQPHRAHNSGQLMRYLLRTKQRARYSPGGLRMAPGPKTAQPRAGAEGFSGGMVQQIRAFGRCCGAPSGSR